MPTAKKVRCVVVGIVAAAICSIACGSRGPLDDSPVFADAGADAPIVASGDAAADTSTALPFGDAGPSACVGCFATQCSAPILACLQSPGCVAVFGCVFSTCLGSGGGSAGGLGGLDTGCLLKCGTSDPTGLVPILQIAGCLTGKCGSECAGVIGGGLGGLPGFGGSSSGRSERLDDRHKALHDVFAPWPELDEQLSR